MNIDKDVVMITKTKFQDIKEKLDNDYYKIYKASDPTISTYNCRFDALKKAVDELLTLLDRSVS